MIAVLGPIANEASLKYLLTAIFYIMVPPFMNPIIYSLWNKEINTAIEGCSRDALSSQADIFLIKMNFKTREFDRIWVYI